MCAVESPTGADPTRESGPAEAAPGRGFSRAAAARIVGLAPSALSRWERVLFDRAGLELGATLTFADLVALAVLSATERCLGAGTDAFAAGHAQVFDLLRDRADVEHLDGYAALVSRDEGHIAERYDHEICATTDILVIPLRPILANFRGQAFA